MAWNVESSGSGLIRVTIKRSSGDVSRDFDANLTIAEVVLPYATEQGLKNFDVEDADGNTIDEDEGTSKLASVGALFLIPQAIGA